MIKFEDCTVVGFEESIRGMRNPKNSWLKSDSYFVENTDSSGFRQKQINVSNGVKSDCATIGPNDLNLMRNLYKAGTDHRKFMRMICVYVDITAPMYWWKEFDTYKVGTVANSCSTMHTITNKQFELEDFSCEHLRTDSIEMLKTIMHGLNVYMEDFLETKDKEYWWQIIQMLPSSYNQKRTVMFNYEVISNIIKSRTNHKLDEWNQLVAWCHNLPFYDEITKA